MTYAIQRMLGELGEAGCYYLAECLMATLRGKKVDVVAAFEYCVEKKWIYYNQGNSNDANNCFVNDGANVWAYLNGDPENSWVLVKESAMYAPRPGDVILGRYELTTTKGTQSHFVGMTDRLTPIADPMGSSLTVQKGKLVSLRVLRRK